MCKDLSDQMNIAPAGSACLDVVTYKQCSGCLIKKSLTAKNFARRGTRSDGTYRYESICKSCKSQADSCRYKKSRKQMKVERKLKAKAPRFQFEVSYSDAGADLEKVIELCTQSLGLKFKEKIFP